MKYQAIVKGPKSRGKRYKKVLSAEDFTPTLACTHQDIKEVHLKARGNDGWYVESIATYTAGRNKKIITKLTTDPGFSMWVDDNEKHLYPYNAKEHLLTNTVPGSCITYIRVNAMTGNKAEADFSITCAKNHLIVLILSNNQTLQAQLEGPMKRDKPYKRQLHFASRFQTRQCVSLSDIKEIHLQTQNGGDDGWYIASIRTSAKSGEGEYEDLTNDQQLDKWLDYNDEKEYPYNAKDIKLTWVDQETLNCEYGKPTCECRAGVELCIFNLEIDEIRTFTSYQKLSLDEPTGIAMRGTQGVIYYFDEDGTPTPLQTNRTCSTKDSAKCTIPQFVDGKTYRLAIAVNGQIPGPTLIVHEGQEVEIHVHNNLTTEGISIHWHGMHQRGTPWMDGVGQVTQCPIGPQTSFSYRYKATPSGTFWYHSHSGAQRTDGFYGSLVVRETRKRIKKIRAKLHKRGVIHGGFHDLPDRHTLSFLDWQQEESLDLFTQIQGAVGFYPGKEHGEVPTPKDDLYNRTVSFEGAGVGPIPYFSGLINGKGRHTDVPYIQTRLSIFTVEAGNTYRFRLVGAQGLYAYRFSIDGHKLTVVGTDGYWLEPEEDVDYIIIHTGERYDFLLNATNTEGLTDYWMRAETLEIDTPGAWPPYQSLGHVAEAILHYKRPQDSDDPDVNVPSTQYQAIKERSPAIECTNTNPCKAVNCPFLDFHPSYHITCVNIQDLRLLEPTPPNELPRAIPKGPEDCPRCKHFINFSFEGDSDTSSVNGRNFIFPSFPPQTRQRKFRKKDKNITCDLMANCNPFTTACTCVHVIDIPQNETVQMVFSAIGVRDNAHPIHLHGHTFHVVHIGYPEYNNTTGIIGNHTSDIYCDDINCGNEGCEPKRCTRPSWAETFEPDFSIDSKTVRKDTVMVPAGGYVVINFISDNPGWWFLHCHIEIHQLQGMAMIVNEISDEPLRPPKGMKNCGDFQLRNRRS